MPEPRDPFDDDLGPDPIDREGGKAMGGGEGTGGGSTLDPSYEDALRILGRADEMPSPTVQMPLLMSNPEAAELAQRLTALRQAAGVGQMLHSNIGLMDEAPSIGQAVLAFIATLQEMPPDQPKLNTLRQQIEQAGGEVQHALEQVCEHSAVRSKLGS